MKNPRIIKGIGKLIEGDQEPAPAVLMDRVHENQLRILRTTYRQATNLVKRDRYTEAEHLMLKLSGCLRLWQVEHDRKVAAAQKVAAPKAPAFAC